MTMLTREAPSDVDVAPSDRPATGHPADASSESPGSLPATALLIVVTLAASAGFFRIFADDGWVLPVLGVAVAVHGASWGARRLAVPRWWSPIIAVVITLLVSVWTVVGATTVVGLPLGGTWSAVRAALDNAQRVMPTVVAPVPDLVGFRLLATWGVGIVALLADWAAFRLRSSLQSVVPGFAMFVVCCVLGTTSGRAWAVATIVASMTLFVLVHRNTVGRAGTVWFANRHHGALPWAVGIGTGLLAMAAAVIVVPNLAPTEGRGILGWKQGPAAGGARSVISPIVDLRTRLVTEATTPVMTVASPVPSYWRLTSLDTFTGLQWQSTNSYLAIGDRLPGVRAAPPGTRQVTQQFHLQSLDSIWLPAAFSPESIVGGGHVTYDPVSGSLLTDRATANGLSYTLTSLQDLATLSTRALQAASPPASAGTLAHDVALPPLPAQIHALAAKITAGKTTEYDKALALQEFFLGPTFQYSLSPPSDGYGTDALSTFLFTTRIGYCQQFAGAYAVLARSIGLPTRLAVGFTSGTSAAGRYQVTDADAHTWPEVYFTGYGWLPFEPTKGGFEIPGASGYTGHTSSATPGAPAPAAVQAAPAPSPSRVPTTTAAPGGAPLTVPHPVPTSSPALSTGVIAIGLVGGAALAWLALINAGRALRWRHRRRRAILQGLGGPAEVMAIWAETEELLQWWGICRRVDETFSEVATRAGTRLGALLSTAPEPLPVPALAPAGGPSPGTGRLRARIATSPWSDLDALADWADWADWADGALRAGAVDQARCAGHNVASTLRRGAGSRLWLRWLTDPRLAWRGPRCA
ncbi:MAG: DUF3488 and transglutaminase-like domain-containing protein [Actinomycetota bacterium]|nr:DUF3488 and transglutaminase-like domain-containing protein [Actinomycetota bacterium]